MKKSILSLASFLLIYTANAQVALVEDIYQGWISSSPAGMTEFDGKLFFGAYHDQYGMNSRELFYYDGSQVQGIDVVPGATDGINPMHMYVHDGVLYFNGTTTGEGSELWKFNGTDAIFLQDFEPGASSSSPRDFTTYNNDLYFVANEQLWKYNGSFTEIIPSGGGNPTYITNLFVFQNKLYFTGDADGYDDEIWSYDGSNFSIVEDLNPGGLNGQGSYAQDFTIYDGKLFFTATNGVTGRELYSFDGSTISLEFDIPDGGYPQQLTVYNNQLYFSAENSTTGNELWRFSGNTASLVQDYTPGLTSFGPSYLTVYSGRLYFSGETMTSARELYMYDGSGISLVADINPGNNSSQPTDIVVFDDKLVFSAMDNTDIGTELWSYRSPDVGIDDIADQFNVTISPNPTPGIVNIDMRELSLLPDASITVYGTDGRIILQESSLKPQMTVDLGDVSNGMYLLQLSNNDVRASKRIIVQH